LVIDICDGLGAIFAIEPRKTGLLEFMLSNSSKVSYDASEDLIAIEVADSQNEPCSG
jgi:hypothetical protein